MIAIFNNAVFVVVSYEPPGIRKRSGHISTYHAEILNTSCVIRKQSGIYTSDRTSAMADQPCNCVTSSIKVANKRNRLPAKPFIVKFPTFGKIRFGKLNIRHH